VNGAAVLCVATVLFLLRVVGQIEVPLLAPDWLPPMQAWYSGLLPAQILLLMLMAVLAYQRTGTPAPQQPSAQAWRVLRGMALGYFAVMVLRLLVTLRAHGGDLYLHGGIPIACHWVLALFLLVYARATPRKT
jgi:hypothetical protein